MVVQFEGPTARARTVKAEIAAAVAHLDAAMPIIVGIVSFTADERIAIADEMIRAYAKFHNVMYAGAVGLLAQDRDVQKHLRVRNEWELLTDIGGVARNKVKAILDSVTLVDGGLTAAIKYLPLGASDESGGAPTGVQSARVAAEVGAGMSGVSSSGVSGVGDTGVSTVGSSGSEGWYSGSTSEHDSSGEESIGIFDPQPTTEPIEVSFGDAFKAGAANSEAGVPGGPAAGTIEQEMTLAELIEWEERNERAAAKSRESKARQRARNLELLEEAARNPYKADALKKITEFLVAYSDQLKEGGETLAESVTEKLHEIMDRHTDINAFGREASDYLKLQFPNPRPSEEYISKNRGIRFRQNDQRTGYLIGGFITNEDHRALMSLIRSNVHAMNVTRSEELRKTAAQHAAEGVHADGKLCEACQLVRDADAAGKELAFRKSSTQERDLDALIYTLNAGAGEQQEIAVETFIIPELAYLDAQGKLRTGSAVRFINFDEVLGFKGKRKMAVGCDASTGQPLVAGWIDPSLNANRAIGMLTKGMVFAQHQSCCGEGCDEPFENCELHHIIPFAEDGPTTAANLIPLCKKCHVRMRTLNESRGGAFYEKWTDGTIVAHDKDGVRVIEQFTDNWIKEHIDDGWPVPVLVITEPLPLKGLVMRG